MVEAGVLTTGTDGDGTYEDTLPGTGGYESQATAQNNSDHR